MTKKPLDPIGGIYSQEIGKMLSLNPPVQSSQIRALYLPVYSSPYVLQDSIDDIKRYAFNTLSTTTLSFDEDYAILVSDLYDKSYEHVNFFATTLLRSMYTDLQMSSYILYGPALIMGLNEHSSFSSVPLDILDSIMNLMTRFTHENP